MIDHFSGMSGYKKEPTWTLLYIDREGTSPQRIMSFGWEDAEEAAREADREHDWLRAYVLVAAIQGEPEVRMGDDNRTEERGLHPLW